jgi:UDPglucose--hexose-1-phosphate uridylyltransferase
MVTTEIRRDPITGRMVVIDRGLFKRRDDFDLEPARLDDRPAACPFCEGREADAGPEILAWRDGGPANVPGWSVRVVPNRHPMLRIEGGMEVRSDGMWETRDGLGAHEVIIETPLHDQPLHALDPDRLWRVLWAWRTRMQDLRRDSRFASILVFKNHGRAAGARLDHAHSQLTAYPVLPPALAEKVQVSSQHHEATGHCIFCDTIAAEARDGRRIIDDRDAIIAFAPFASRVPFETWLMPRDHSPRFEDADDKLLEGLAAGIRAVMTAIDWALERPAYNLVLHSAPLSGVADTAFHWHLEILPRVTRYSGQEWASGAYRNPVAPEEAASVLRNRVAAGG